MLLHSFDHGQQPFSLSIDKNLDPVQKIRVCFWGIVEGDKVKRVKEISGRGDCNRKRNGFFIFFLWKDTLESKIFLKIDGLKNKFGGLGYNYSFTEKT